ncbi:MAG: FHA domain-containing protein [Candidatus Schekmanbacteria bacterium]|nr:FHA domain-containing protein [Candidatus Schekmanbacteria bacterium]
MSTSESSSPAPSPADGPVADCAAEPPAGAPDLRAELPRLVVMHQGGSLCECILERDDTRVGRDPDNDVVLSAIEVSRFHARVFRRGDLIFLEDGDSANGTLLNGKPVDCRLLVHGSEIRIGGFDLLFRWPSQRIPAEALANEETLARIAMGRTQSVRGGPEGAPAPGVVGESGRSSASRAPQSRGGLDVAIERTLDLPREAADAEVARPGMGESAAGSAAPLILEGMSGPTRGKWYAFDRDVVILGRSEGADIIIDDDSVSRVHARLVRVPCGYEVHDLGSTNGTRLDDVPVSPRARLTDGARLMLGDVELVVRSAGAVAVEEPRIVPQARPWRPLLHVALGAALMAAVTLATFHPWTLEGSGWPRRRAATASRGSRYGMADRPRREDAARNDPSGARKDRVPPLLARHTGIFPPGRNRAGESERVARQGSIGSLPRPPAPIAEQLGNQILVQLDHPVTNEDASLLFEWCSLEIVEAEGDLARVVVVGDWTVGEALEIVQSLPAVTAAVPGYYSQVHGQMITSYEQILDAMRSSSEARGEVFDRSSAGATSGELAEEAIQQAYEQGVQIVAPPSEPDVSSR